MLPSKVSGEESVHTSLPPVLIVNPRKIIEPDQISVEELAVLDKEEHTQHGKSRMFPYPEEPLPLPIPKFSLEMIWNPNNLYFVLEEEPVIHRVRIWNSSNRPMYFFNCGLWGDMARLGASWWCYPHTRIWLAPGLTAVITVKATPRLIAPVPCAVASMQIAAGHLRDNVTGYFSIPIQAKYLKYILPPPPEGEYNE